MKRVKLKHCYHDALIRAVRYRDGADILLDVDLCSCCNPSPGRVTLCLNGVRNFAVVKEAFESARHKHALRPYIDELIGIARDPERGYLLDLAIAGGVRVDASRLHEA